MIARTRRFAGDVRRLAGGVLRSGNFEPRSPSGQSFRMIAEERFCPCDTTDSRAVRKYEYMLNRLQSDLVAASLHLRVGLENTTFRPK
jgi:hypothetical protein